MKTFFLKRTKEHFFVSGRKMVHDDMGIKMSQKKSSAVHVCDGYVKYRYEEAEVDRLR